MVTIHKAVGCAVLVFAAAVAGCGGGGGDASSASGGGGPPLAGSGWVAGSFLPASSFAGKCVNPRTGTNPQTGQPYNETRGTATDDGGAFVVADGHYVSARWPGDAYRFGRQFVALLDQAAGGQAR